MVDREKRVGAGLLRGRGTEGWGTDIGDFI